MSARSLRVLIGSPAVGAIAAGTVADRRPAGVILLDLGADHPSRAGLLELRIWLADRGGDVDRQPIERAELIVGAMHRGAEKLYEVRDYRQILMLADRHDWQAPAAAELSIAAACEQLLGLEVPTRAQWLRTLLAEHNRILSHLGFLGYLWFRRGLPTPVPQAREQLRRQLQRWTGNRVHPMVNRLGGLAADVDAGWLSTEERLAETIMELADRAGELITDSELLDASERAGALGPKLITAYGVTGPAARAAGVDLDLRRQRPYLCYSELADELAPVDQLDVTADGSAIARFQTLISELRASARMIKIIADRLRRLTGPVSVKLGKIVKLPEGEIYLATEAPLGQAGCYLVSRGEKTPWRLKLRTPSFNNVAVLEALLPGCLVGDLELVLASTGYVVGDIDK